MAAEEPCGSCSRPERAREARVQQGYRMNDGASQRREPHRQHSPSRGRGGLPVELLCEAAAATRTAPFWRRFAAPAGISSTHPEPRCAAILPPDPLMLSSLLGRSSYVAILASAVTAPRSVRREDSLAVPASHVASASIAQLDQAPPKPAQQGTRLVKQASAMALLSGRGSGPSPRMLDAPPG